MFAITLGLVAIVALIGQIWIFRDAKERLGWGQGLVWAGLYFVGIFFWGFGELVILLMWCHMRPAKPKSLLDSLQRLLPGSPPNLRHCCFGTAIALDPSEKKLALISPRAQKVYRFSDIRQYRWNIQQDGRYVSYLPFDFAVARENNRIARSNRDNTGLFVQVRDIEVPEWQVHFRRKSEIQRWFEILTQATEGQLAAS